MNVIVWLTGKYKYMGWFYLGMLLIITAVVHCFSCDHSAPAEEDPQV